MTHLLTVSLVGRLTDCLEEGWEQIRLKASKSESPQAETELQMSIMITLFLQEFLQCFFLNSNFKVNKQYQMNNWINTVLQHDVNRTDITDA